MTPIPALPADEATVRNTAGQAIFYRSWRPAAPPRAVVVICHGVNAHSGHHRWAAEQLVQAGLAVHALDLRGRGRSEGVRFYIEDIQDYVEDLELVVERARTRDPGLPVYLLGHSAGGVVACTYALDHPGALAGLICESFAFEVPAPDLALSLIRGLSRLIPRAPVLKLQNADFSRDPDVVAGLDADPLIAGEAQPARTVAALSRADLRLKTAFPRLTLPVLILHGDADKVTRPSGSRAFFAAAGSPDKTLKIYPGHVHDLLADLGREAVMADIRGWIAARLPHA